MSPVGVSLSTSLTHPSPSSACLLTELVQQPSANNEPADTEHEPP